MLTDYQCQAIFHRHLLSMYECTCTHAHTNVCMDINVCMHTLEHMHVHALGKYTLWLDSIPVDPATKILKPLLCCMQAGTPT
jgi:hypothetical protein|mmetsp:Transcript_70936/g.118805  ORF Transcript_70936/g.118805 Transcript_70936/m.118805 type:complete len:82 (-) Transcript_70936:2655-2900(-)